MAEPLQPAAISGIKDAKKIRVVLFANGKFVHISLVELLAAASTLTEG